MNKETQAISNDLGQLAEDARALMAATADVAGEKVGEARKRLAAALERAREIATCVKAKAVEGAKAADVAVQEASKTLRGITGAHVKSMSAEVSDGKISQYRTTVDIAFGLER